MPVTPELARRARGVRRGRRAPGLPRLGRHRELRDAGRPRPRLDRPRGPRHRPRDGARDGERRERPRDRRRHDRRHGRRRQPGRPDRGHAATRSSASTSPSPAGSSTRPRRSGRPPRGDPRGAARGRRRPSSPAVGITNQRETVVLWDRETLGSPRRAIVWQDRRTADICRRMRDEGHEDRVAELTGLRLDPYFSGTKLALARRGGAAHLDPRRVRAVRGRHRRLLPGRPDDPRRLHHVTDVSNASRTLLFDLAEGDWSDELCALFGVPRDALPELVPNWGEVATHRPEDVLRAVAADRGDRRRPAVGAVRPDLLRRGRLQVHLRHRVVHPAQHRHRRCSAPTPGCCRPRRGAPPTAS